MEIREMTVNDLKEVAKLYAELACFIKNEIEDDYFNFASVPETEIERQLRKSLGKPGFITLTAIKEGKLIAFISGAIKECFLPFSEVKKVGYISAAYVLPQYRGQGVIKCLESLLSDYFKAQGLSYIELHVITANFIAKKSWEALGYRTFREQMRKKI